MKFVSTFLVAFQVLCILLFSTAVRADDGVTLSDIKNAVDVFFTAVGTQVSDAGLATALSSVPSATKGILVLYPNQRMQTITLAIGDHPDRQAELLELRNRYQAIQSAIAGDNTALKKILKDERRKKAQARQGGPGDKQKMDQEEEEMMNYHLQNLRKKLRDIYNSCKDDIEKNKEMGKNLNDLKKDMQEQQLTVQRFILSVENIKISISGATSACINMRNLEKETKAYAVRIHDNEKKYDNKIELAQKRAAACSNTADVVFIKSSYDEAKQLAVQMGKDALEIQNLAQKITEYDIKFKRIKNTSDELYPKLEKEWRSQDTELVLLINKTVDCRTYFEKPLLQVDQAHERFKKLKPDIHDYANYYSKRFPQSKGEWDFLKNEFNDKYSRIVETIDIAPEMTESRKTLDQMIKTRKKLSDNLNDIKKINQINCDKDSFAEQAINDAEWRTNATLLRLAADESLLERAENCRKKIAQIVPSSTSQTGSGTPANPPTVAPQSTTPSGPKTSYAGGLFISGKKYLVSGEGATYVAHDGAGQTYSSGVSWNSSVEDVFVMGEQGAGVAFKAGISTIIAHKDDMVAYFDVEVAVRVPNLVGKGAKEALSTLQGLGLKGKVPARDTSVKNGRIKSQSVAPGTPIGPDTPVVIEVESGWGSLASSDSGGYASEGSAWGTWAPEDNPPEESGDFVAPGSIGARSSIENTDEKIRPKGKRIAADMDALKHKLDRKLARQQSQANQFFSEGITATANSVTSIAASNIKRKTPSKPAKTTGPSYNIGPVGPNWNPVDGWGKPGQVSTGAITCPEDYNDCLKKCQQTDEYLQKQSKLEGSSDIWDANIKRARQFKAQCCGVDQLARKKSIPQDNPEAAFSGMTETECINKFCPQCASAISLMGVSADSGCEDCKKRNAANIKACMSGGNPLSTVSDQNGSDDFKYDTRGLKNPKVYFVYKQYQPGQNDYHYTIGKHMSAGLEKRTIIYGPDTFENCREWARKKGYWVY